MMIVRNILMLKKGDIVLIISIIIIAAVFVGMRFFNNKNQHRIAEIIQDKVVVKRIDLDKVNKQERIKVPGLFNEIVLVEQGRIRFEQAECPDKVCVKTGWLSRTGDSATCIPNRAMIRIIGENKELDGVAF
jgi:hypothetical protein